MLAGSARDATPLELALVDLVRKATFEPAQLTPADLEPVRAIVGDGALDHALVVATFHFINRVADLLHVEPEVLPASLRRFDVVRRVMVRAMSIPMRRMDLAVRPYATTYEEAVARLAPVLARTTGAAPGERLRPLAARPKLIEVLQLALEERERSTVDRDTLARIHRTVETALPACPDDVAGFHARPSDPVEAFAFVGTRYAQRTTADMIRALRRDGRDDVAILDLAIAVASANQWARLHRLAGLAPDLFYVAGVSGRRVA